MSENIKVQYVTASYGVEEITSLILEIRINGEEIGVVYQNQKTEWIIELIPNDKFIKLPIDIASQILDKISQFISELE